MENVLAGALGAVRKALFYAGELPFPAAGWPSNWGRSVVHDLLQQEIFSRRAADADAELLRNQHRRSAGSSAA